MNAAWALSEIDVFIAQTEMRYPDPVPGFVDFTGYMETASSNDDITKQAHVVEQIMDRVVPGWRDLDVSNQSNQWMKHRTAALRAREALRRDQEINENLGENAPEISAAKLHPWVWSGAKSLWQSGHFREAVEGAIKKLNAEAQNKVERRDVSESDLFQQAFSLNEPAVGKARLRLMQPDGSRTYQSLQRGAMAFAEGIFAAIRNPLSHELGQELSEQEALEYLAALSVLARWVDKATCERVEDRT